MTAIGGMVCPIAISFLAEGVHYLHGKIKERDKKVKLANHHITKTKKKWEYNLRNITEEDPTPGELEEIRTKEKILKKMKYYKRPMKLSSRNGYSIKLDFSFEVSFLFTHKMILIKTHRKRQSHDW